MSITDTLVSITDTLVIIMIGLFFVLIFLSSTASSQTQRQKYRVSLMVIFLILVSIIMVSIFVGTASIHPMLIIASATIWALLIGRLFIQQRISSCIAKSRVDKSNWLPVIVGIIYFMLLSVSIVTAPNTVNLIDHKYYYDCESIPERISILLLTTPAIILCIMAMIERTTFSEEGIIHGGFQWAWSDFHNYTWRTRPKDAATAELFLDSKRSWPIKSIKIITSAEDRPRIEALLAQKINKEAMVAK